jgi:magnesium transporter
MTTEVSLLPPSEVLPAGGPTASDGILDGHSWSPAGSRTLETVTDAREVLADPSARVWIDLEDASPATLTQITACLGLHPLIVEDIIERNQRAKVDITGDTMHLVMFGLAYEAELEAMELDIVLGSRFLLTSHPAGWRPHEMENVRRLGVDHFLSEGTDYMLYAVVDALVDGYFPVLDSLGNQIDALEDEVVRRPTKDVVERLFDTRRSLLEVRHTVSPEREVFNQLTNREMPLIDPDRIIYFRDVYDHLIRITDELDSYRELVSGALDAYLSTINNNLSEIMKRLTAITAILAGVGAAAGIFGMSEAATAFNFQEGGGFWLVTFFCVLIGVGVFLYFRRIHWI